MARISRARGHNPRFPGNRLASGTEPAVALLGMQGRLVRGDAERGLAHLLHRYQCVREEWDRVIR